MDDAIPQVRAFWACVDHGRPERYAPVSPRPLRYVIPHNEGWNELPLGGGDEAHSQTGCQDVEGQ